jgi:hypothetical protein
MRKSPEGAKGFYINILRPCRGSFYSLPITRGSLRCPVTSRCLPGSAGVSPATLSESAPRIFFIPAGETPALPEGKWLFFKSHIVQSDNVGGGAHPWLLSDRPSRAVNSQHFQALPCINLRLIFPNTLRKKRLMS